MNWAEATYKCVFVLALCAAFCFLVRGCAAASIAHSKAVYESRSIVY